MIHKTHHTVAGLTGWQAVSALPRRTLEQAAHDDDVNPAVLLEVVQLGLVCTPVLWYLCIQISRFRSKSAVRVETTVPLEDVAAKPTLTRKTFVSDRESAEEASGVEFSASSGLWVMC